MRFARIEMDVPARSGLTREGHAPARGSMEGMREESKEFALATRPRGSLVGSESKDEDMAAYVRAADVVHNAFGCVVRLPRRRKRTSTGNSIVARPAFRQSSAINMLSAPLQCPRAFR
jgi:hypothetical protein